LKFKPPLVSKTTAVLTSILQCCLQLTKSPLKFTDFKAKFFKTSWECATPNYG